jgi:hypothetical protein
MVKNLNAGVDNCNFSGEWPEWAEKIIDECHKLDQIERNPSISGIYKKYYNWVIFRNATKKLHC